MNVGAVRSPVDDAFGLRSTARHVAETSARVTAVGTPPTRAETVAFREAAQANGWLLVPVLTGKKAPVGRDWQTGRSDALLLKPTADQLNTGIRCDGLRVVDLDVGSATKIAALRKLADEMLGVSPVARGRADSSRLALFYRAALGEPSKQEVSGALEAGRDGKLKPAKVEVLGRGQQLVTHGLHPEGEAYTCEGDKGPHNLTRASLPSVTEGQVAAFLVAAQGVIGAKPDPTGGANAPFSVAVPLAGTRPDVFNRPGFPQMNAAAQAGLSKPEWFEGLTADGMNAMVRQIFVQPEIAKLTDAPREEWLRPLFGAADAGRLGATDARQVALEWSKLGHAFIDEGGFDRDWASFREGRSGIGTLLQLAAKAGMDLAPWRARAGAAAAQSVAALSPTVVASGAFFDRVRFAKADRVPVPWVVQGLAITGDVTVIAAPGGGAKTVAMMDLLVTIAAGRPYWGPFAIKARADGQPHRVAIISAEESRGRLGLLVAAAASGMTRAEQAAVEACLVAHDARESGFAIGTPRPGQREQISPEGQDQACADLLAALVASGVTLVVLDTLAALFALPNENDNAAVTMLMRRVGKVAADAGCAVILLHHTPKVTKEGAAAQRGEATMVRGGGAVVNSARVVWTLTMLPAGDAAPFAMAGINPAAIRRLDPVKLNDAQPPPPAFFDVIGVPVQMSTGAHESVRAIRFVSAPQPGAVPDAIRDLAMKVIDTGMMVNGARVDLSPAHGQRSAVEHIASAIQAANPGTPYGREMARQVLADLLNRLRCVIERDTKMPKTGKNGAPNGFGTAKGLGTDWSAAPWAGPTASAATASIPAPPPAAATPPAAKGTP